MIEHCAKRCIILNRRLHESGILNAKVERLRGGRAYSRPYSRLLRDHPKPSTHSFCAAGKRKHEARRVVDQFEIVIAEQGCPALVEGDQTADLRINLRAVQSTSDCKGDGSAISPSIVPYDFKFFLFLVTIVLPVACAPQRQTHPLDTAPIPASARILEEPCSPLGAMMCGAVSILSGETAVERRSACIIYVEPSGRRVEQCGSLPTSHP